LSQRLTAGSSEWHSCRRLDRGRDRARSFDRSACFLVLRGSDPRPDPRAGVRVWACLTKSSRNRGRCARPKSAGQGGPLSAQVGALCQARKIPPATAGDRRAGRSPAAQPAAGNQRNYQSAESGLGPGWGLPTTTPPRGLTPGMGGLVCRARGRAANESMRASAYCNRPLKTAAVTGYVYTPEASRAGIPSRRG
jgi:hypothetical protein